MSNFDPSAINAKVLDLMRQHGTNWKKPWIESSDGFMPMNVTRKQPYHGINIFILLTAGRTSRWWATYQQWQALGAQVQGGEKGIQIILFRFIERKNRETDKVESIPLIRTFTVFNSEQVTGWTPPVDDKPKMYDTKGSEVVDDIFTKCSVDVRYGDDRAFWSPTADYIGMPKPEQFKDPVAYDGTRLHELGHWTGHKSRLDRSNINFFGSEDYAKEELVAELFSLYMGLTLGIEVEMRPDHAQYLNNWMQAIKQDKWTFYHAAQAAEKGLKLVIEMAGLDVKVTSEEGEKAEAVEA